MQVAKAGRPRNDAAVPSSLAFEDRAASYAPLYLTSVLGRESFDIEELQGMALRRLQLLKGAVDANELAGVTSAETPGDALRRAEREAGFNIPPVGNADREESILRDEASHFLLRLALCRNHDQRTWLLSRECALFSMRLERAGTDYALDKIKAADGPDIKRVSDDVLLSLRPDLDAVARGVRKMATDDGTIYYEVAFEHVSSLVRGRRVLLRKGVAFVPERNVRDIVTARFRAKLNHALITASKAVGLTEHDPRIRTILEAVRSRHAAEESSRIDFEDGRGADKISLNQLLAALPAMPLCQQNLMQRLREDHHLRHGGRMQLGVFLKGCGLSVDESLVFWRSEFAKGGLQSDKFDKNYAYNIRHHYGKEGKRKNLAPFPCIRIINERPGPGEHHGCPYREFPHNRLKDTLRRIGTPDAAIGPITASARDGNFQAACGLCFAGTQPGHHERAESGNPVYFPSHPNDYFIEGRKRQTRSGDEEDEDAEFLRLAEEAEEMTAQHPEKTQTTQIAEDNVEDEYEGLPGAKRLKVDEAGSDTPENDVTDEESASPTELPPDGEAAMKDSESKKDGEEDAPGGV
jgi:DNA primase large subunit